MKKSLGLASAFLLAATLTACSDSGSSSGSSSDDYCQVLKDTKQDLTNLDQGQLNEQTFSDLKEKINKLEESAPAAVADDWRTIGDGMDQMKGVLDAAGISLDDLEGMNKGQLPEGVDMAKLTELGNKLNEITKVDSRFDKATKAVEQQAKDVCKVDLGSSTTAPTL